MKITNKDVIQSYIVTTARYDFSVYEKRILYRIIEMQQELLEGKKLTGKFSMQKGLFGDKHITMPISSFLADEKDTNYDRVKQALIDLESKSFQYEDDEVWKLIRIIQRPVVQKHESFVSFILQPEIYDALLNFSKGFRKFELKTAMTFNSAYAMRFYELLSGQIKPITYTIENLKIMFQVQDKYKKINDFIKRVIEPARVELDDKSPFSFTYKSNYVGKKINTLTFFPYKTKNIDDNLAVKRLEKQVSIAWDLDAMVINYLKENYYFDTDEIKHNREILIEASKKIDLMLFLANKRRAATNKANPKGWLINAIKGELKRLVPVL